MAWHILRQDEIDAFKASWPAHGLPDTLHSLAFEFDGDGNLIDIEAYQHNADGTESRLDASDFDGPALLALSQDAFEHGDNA